MAFDEDWRELGYVEGKNYVIEYRSADGRDERFPGLAAELVRLQVDLILTRGTPAALAAKNATGTIPVVITGVGDPLGQGLVAGLPRPGGNITGLSATVNETYPKRVDLLRELVPGAARIAALFNMSNPAVPAAWKEVEMAARSVGIQAQLLDAESLRIWIGVQCRNEASVPMRSSWDLIPSRRRTSEVSSTSRRSIGCRRFTHRWSLSAGCSPTGLTTQTCIARRTLSPTKSSRVPSPPISPLSSRPSRAGPRP